MSGHIRQERASRRIRCLRQLSQRVEKSGRLTDKQAGCGQKINRTHGSTAGFGRTNDRADREFSIEKNGRLRHDQISLKSLTSKWRSIQIRKYQTIGRVSKWRGIACLILPGLKVHRLRRADAQQNSQHFLMRDALRQRGIKAGSPLFDHRKVKAGGIGDRLEMRRWLFGSRTGQITIVSWNRRKLPLHQSRNSLRESIPEIRVLRAASVARPPTGIHAKLHEVGKPPDLLRPCRLAAGE